MSSNENLTNDEKLAKMKSILEAHIKQRKRTGTKLRSAQKRLKGAVDNLDAYKKTPLNLQSTEEASRLSTLVRRFEFDVKQIQDSLEDVKSKENWARKMIRKIEIAMSINSEGQLVHRPLATLSSYKLG